MKRSKSKARPKRSPNEFPDHAKQAMRVRSGGRCEARTADCVDAAQVFHHRKSRSSKDQRPVNGLHVCDPCHKHIHANVTKSRLMGWIVPSWSDPAEVPVRPGAGGR